MSEAPLCDLVGVEYDHRHCRDGRVGAYLTESVFKVIFRESIPTQIRQLIIHISNNKGQVDEFVRKLTYARRLYKHFLRDKTALIALVTPQKVVPRRARIYGSWTLRINQL